jgi:hypothetical protein
MGAALAFAGTGWYSALGQEAGQACRLRRDDREDLLVQNVREASVNRYALWALVGALLLALAALALPDRASAHLERPSYWPDPAPDRSVKPAAGGGVPKQRSLRSAVTGKGPGKVRVVCKGPNGRKSMGLLRKYINRSQNRGYRVRPSEDRRRVSKKQGRRLVRMNKKLAKKCKFRTIQAAVDKTGNNDRVVIMPGRYTEKPSRDQPVNDPRCADLTQTDTSGRETPSYAYQVNCPHDQNLIYIGGRKVPNKPPPSPPLNDRHGIPDEGKCVQCNVQLEGSGLRPVDVVIDAAKKGLRNGPAKKPGEAMKDVVLRADRADGIVVANMTLKGGLEHGFYTEETDGYLLNRVKMFWNLDYGNLSFTADHGKFKNCDGLGSGDAVLYPGAAPETGEQAKQSFYPDAPRVNTVIKKCDMRGSVLGYSGSMGNAVRITDSEIYGNSAGISADSISASGHPGYPTDSMVIDNNNIFSNNVNFYAADYGLEPRVGIPVGVGILWPGMNAGVVRDNHIFDNWRYGAMLFAIPDLLVTPENEVQPGISCATATPVEDPADNSGQSTSCNNRFFNNVMGRAPQGFEMPAGFPTLPVKASAMSGVREAESARAYEVPTRMPNGLDFWWDEFPTNTENCWYDNIGSDGTKGSITSDPPIGPVEGVNEPGTLPDECSTSIGNGVNYAPKLAANVECVNWSRGNDDSDFAVCDWFRTPPKPDGRPTATSADGGEKLSPKQAKQQIEQSLESVEGTGAWAER